MNPYLEDLRVEWAEQGHRVGWAHNHRDLGEAATVFSDPADSTVRPLCFCLGYDRIVPRSFRDRCEHTLVVHESDLPKGRGWSPLTWQIHDGANHIPVTLIEAADDVDSGPVYAQRWITFEGHELIDELRAAQAEVTHAVCRAFVDGYPDSAAHGREQTGEATYYQRRRPVDSGLDPERSLAAQFDQLRVADNRHYPAFFECRGHRYVLQIERAPGEACE